MTHDGTKSQSKSARPPIVVVMGHIDHGKTTLLDYIRKTKVAEREAGGITQALGAYQIEVNGKSMTVLDTPGHEAFSAMRARGAHVADVAIVVVAADEGVKPQTIEAIRIARAAELPFVVALNKIDRPNADPARVKKELADAEVLVEGYGGTIPTAEISAKTGQGVDGLLETVELLAELEELSWNPKAPATGIVIESHLDPKRGATATLLVENGTLRSGEFLVMSALVAPVRIFENFLGTAIREAHAADPVRVAGLAAVPGLGERFAAFAGKEDAEAARALPAAPASAAPPREEPVAKTLVNVILKTDVLGSKEAIEALLAAIGSAELAPRILKSETGDVNENDVKFAATSKNTFIVGFHVRVPPRIQELADRNGVRVVTRDVIYDLVEAVKQTLMAMAPSEISRVRLGQAKILALFKAERGEQIVGGEVSEGTIRSGVRFDIIRNQRTIGRGRILELQSQRRPAEEVSVGQQFGIRAESDLAIAAGDVLDVFAEERTSPSLA